MAGWGRMKWRRAPANQRQTATRSRAGWKTLPFSLRQCNPREVHLFTVPVTSTIWTQLHGTCLEITTPRNFADSILFDLLFRKTCILTYRETDIRCLKYRYIFAPLHGRALFIRTSHIRDGIAAAWRIPLQKYMLLPWYGFCQSLTGFNFLL